MNPYDWCVANKPVDGRQMKVVWHVDNLKISHENGDMVDTLISKLSKQYRKEVELTIHRVKVHKYLWMKLDYSEWSKVNINMTDHLHCSEFMG